ncbi:N-terminal domain of NEFA-interacting nuclear protein NIP30-domain-containing protein [Trametes elegans]|nr:N-terminal domain of NEFA-interacting nuclear protein NIP30-domain-containing protein [Trametes elegans]
MDDAIPSISTSGVGSRFVSQSELEIAKAKRDEQWKAAYARLGQDPPPQQAVDDAFDGRSLAEKLAANRAAKQEEWEERNKLGNQFRALEEDEVLFLDSVLEKQREEERIRKEMDGEELKHFREAVAARETAANKPPPIGAAAATVSPPPASKPKPSAAPVKKDAKKSLKGVLVKKKASKPAATNASSAPQPRNEQAKDDKSKPNENADGEEREAKRRKVADS